MLISLNITRLFTFIYPVNSPIQNPFCQLNPKFQAF